MNTKQRIDTLWEDFRFAINAAYAESVKTRDEELACLRDYAENISWSDNLARLLGREAAEERRHRSGRPAIKDFSIDSAAKLMIMHFAEQGAGMAELPKATGFLVYRQTAIESEVIGFLARVCLAQEWRESVKSLDYAELMKG
jgi:hypothetical protein